MIPLLLAAAAAQASAIDAERAFADMAQKDGQWTAFRAYAAPDALMFVPGAKNAQEWLKDRKDPPVSVHWWPALSWVSCDRTMAVNVGPALYGIRGNGTFTTVWKRQGDGSWKWVLDQGHQLPRALPAGERPRLTSASCRGRPDISLLTEGKKNGRARPTGAAPASDPMILEEGRSPSSRPTLSPNLVDQPIASGSSADGTFHWRMQAIEGGVPGARVLQLYLWDGRAYRLHLTDLHEGGRRR